jgi:adenylate cyclase
MADIFISYSSKDRLQAELLIELLTSAGLSVWIDRSGIDVATNWSKEIVRAIDTCKAFVVLLSANSIASHNVIKEVSLAAEQKKKMLPLDLEPVALSEDFRYHLAGIQRAQMTNIDGVIRALGKLGLDAPQAPQPPRIAKETWGRKSLMILPFDDLSPTGYHGWFADGIVTELIAALSQIKALRVSDQQATKDYRRYQGTLPNYAREMSISYFVQGSVRKFGDQVKISVTLLDIETGDHLWQDFMKGKMDDIFNIQESVAQKVVEGLKVHLAADERKSMGSRRTDNPEAYELYLKSVEYHNRRTGDDYRRALQLVTTALEIDPLYTSALVLKANALVAIYRNYERSPELLEEAERLALRAIEIRPEQWLAFQVLPNLYLLQGRLNEAEEAAKEFIRRAPDHFSSHFSLAFFYAETKQYALSILPFEKALELKPDDPVSYNNIVNNSYLAGDRDRAKLWAERALPFFERHLRLVPEDDTVKVEYAAMLERVGQQQRASELLMPLLQKQTIDGVSFYNMACIFLRQNDATHAMEALRRSLSSGFKNIEVLRFDPDINALRGTTDFEKLMKEVEEEQKE